MPNVLAIFAEGFEEIEAFTPVDLLRRAGVSVTLATIGEESLLVKGRSGVVFQAEAHLSGCLDKSFDCLLLPGGPHVKHLRADARLKPLIQAYAQNGRWIAAICAAPVLLHDAGLLTGKNYTAHFSIANEVPSILSGLRVAVDGKIITSRGAGTALDFGLMLVSQLVSQSKANEVALAICS